MVWNMFFVFIFGMWVVNSMESYYQPPRSSAVWGYFTPPLLQRVPLQQTPMEAMVELTNNLGVAILQDHSFSRGNFAFSPYGVASVLVVLYEGARGESARQIHRAVGFPFDKDIIRVGFRDIHRHLRSYFSHEGYLSGISLNKQSSSLKPGYKKILKFYGYDVDLNQPFDDDDDDSGSGNKTPETSLTSSMSSTTTASPPQSEMTTAGVADKNITSTTEEEGKSTTSPSTTQQETVTPITVAEDFIQNSTQPNNSDADNITSPTEEEKNSTTTPSTVLTTATTQQEIVTEIQPTNGDANNITNPVEKETNNTTTTTQQETVTPITFTEESIQNSTATQQSNGDAVNVTTVLTTPSTVLTTATTQQEIVTEIQPTNVDANNITNPVEKETNNTTSPSTLPTTLQETVTPSTEGFPQSSTKTQQDVTDEPENYETTTVIPTTEPQNVTAETITNPQDGTTVPTTTEDDNDEEFQINLTIDTEASTSTTESTTGEFFNQTEPETKATATEVEEITNVSIDNGMLIPQPDDRKTTATEPQAITSTTEAFARAAGHNSSDVNYRIREIINSRASLWLTEKPKTRKIRTITDYLKSPHNPDLSLQLQNGMYDTHVSRNADLYRKLPRLLFLVDGAVDTPVPMMIYTNVFSYAYIPRLHSKALEFPLDDVRYKLLILLPIERRGLRQLIYDLADYPLSNVLETVRPARVKAMVPTFMVEGFVILTSSLQKLGIWDVFDPRKANLSGMSTDPELYVRNVEQSVTVVIRNYVEILDIQTRTMAARQMEYEFEATHPFLYFVLDTDTNVALMAGQILDPLNSRIY